MAKFKQRILARELRNKGESIGIIAKNLKVGKSTVSLWCQDILLSKVQKENLSLRSTIFSNKGRLIVCENRKQERMNRVNLYKKIGIRKIGKLSKRDLFLIGAALYWAEGGKNQRKVVFINSNPVMILLWILWAIKCLRIKPSRFICRVEINEIHHDRLKTIENYWSQLTKIPISQFRKASLKHSRTTKVYSNRDSHFGSLQLTLSRGTNLNYEILGYIEGLAGVIDQN